MLKSSSCFLRPSFRKLNEPQWGQRGRTRYTSGSRAGLPRRRVEGFVSVVAIIFDFAPTNEALLLHLDHVIRFPGLIEKRRLGAVQPQADQECLSMQGLDPV